MRPGLIIIFIIKEDGGVAERQAQVQPQVAGEGPAVEPGRVPHVRVVYQSILTAATYYSHFSILTA